MKTLYAFALFSLAGCAGTIANGGKVVQPGKVGGYVRKDLYVNIDGTVAQLGTSVVDYKPEPYKIMIASANKMDVIFIESCHRQWIVYDAAKKYKTKDGGEGFSYEFSYQMVAEAERADCPLNISTLEKEGRRKEYATIAFRSPKYDLEGDLRCNGKQFNSRSVALCQASSGKVQELHFKMPVKWFSQKKECPLPRASEGQHFDFTIPSGSCNYMISTLSAPWRTLSVQTIGYEDEEYSEAL